MQPLSKAVWRFLRKLKIDLPYDPAIALLGIYPRDTGVLMHRATCTPMFIAALSTIAKLWKEHKSSSADEWIKMGYIIYIYYILYIIRNTRYIYYNIIYNILILMFKIYNIKIRKNTNT